MFAANQQSQTPQLRGDRLDRLEVEHDQELWERPTTSSARSYEDDPGPSDPDGNRQGHTKTSTNNLDQFMETSNRFLRLISQWVWY